MILGNYTYKTYTCTSGRPKLLGTHTLRVEVLKATQRKFLVRYMGFHANGSAVNSLHWVGQQKVKLDDPSAAVPRATKDEVETTQRAVSAAAVRDDIRLPYKDND